MYSRRAFLQYSTLDWLHLERRSAEAQAQREAREEANRQALRLREQERAFWALEAAMCRVEPYIGNPQITNLKVIKQYHGALKRALNSLKD